MDSPDNTSLMMSFLKEFNYPLVHSMNYEEMANVFHISNRCFLVCWALKLLDEECYLDVLKDREHDKDLLANLVSQHGFCTGSEKVGFFNGDLPVAEQVQILFRMFNFIKRQKENRTSEGASITNHVPLMIEDLQKFINTNLNIFPTFGEIKTLSEKEKILEINKLQEEIKQFKLQSEHNLFNEQTNTNLCEINKKRLQNNVKKLSENFYQFDRIIKALSKEKRCEMRSNYKINPKSEELLLSCNKYLVDVYQYLEDLKIVNSFTIMDIQEPNDEISPLIEILAGQIHNSLKSV